MFFANSPTGPKEGRFHPGLLSPERRRRYTKRQKHMLIFAVVLLVFVFYSAFMQTGALERFERYEVSSSSLQGTRGPDPSVVQDKQDDGLSKLAQRKETKILDSQSPIVEEDSAKKAEAKMTPVTEKSEAKQPLVIEDVEMPKEKDHEKEHVSPPRPKSKPDKVTLYSDRWTEWPDLKEDLDALNALMPDELSMRELLRPIMEGGAPRMRELGLRTRVYWKYLNAWEKLHLVEDEKTGETYVRDDLIQYLRGTQRDSDLTFFGSPLATTIQKYEAFRGFFAQFSRLLFPFTSPYFANHMTLHAQFKHAGRGIVLTAGDGQANYLLTTIYALRKIGCKLPIEIMYLGDADLGEDYRVELEALSGVTTRDISVMVDDSGWKLAGWAIKPFAIMMSSFREVIFIDADSFFFRDPAKLFEDPSYVSTGALFFRDRTIMPESKRRWLLQILPKPIPKLAKESTWWKGTSGHHQESGVVVVDKWKHFVSMLLICRFNGSDRDGRAGKTGVYEMMHGDKETFWIGFLLANDQSFAFHRGAVGIIGTIEPPNSTTETKSASDDDTSNDNNNTNSIDETEKTLTEPALTTPSPPDNYTICSPQLLHLEVDNTPLWFNGWLLVSKYAEASQRRFAPMKSFLIEPPEDAARTEDFWQLATDNMCCLTSTPESRFEIAEEDLGLLTMMRERALEVGVMS